MRRSAAKTSHTRAGRLLAEIGMPEALNTRVHVVDGDVTQPLCGISRGDLEMLRARVRVLIDAAAVTDLGADASLCERVNLAGTVEALNVATELRAGALWGFAYFSTAFAPGSRQRYRSLQDILPGTPRAANAYEWSKYHAEARVREAMAAGLARHHHPAEHHRWTLANRRGLRLPRHLPGDSVVRAADPAHAPGTPGRRAARRAD